MAELQQRRRVRHRVVVQVNPGKVAQRMAVIQRVLQRLVGQPIPLLQKVDPQHPLQTDRWPAALTLRIKRLQPRHQPRPRHHLLHLGQKLVAPRLLFLAGVRRLRKAPLPLPSSPPRPPGPADSTPTQATQPGLFSVSLTSEMAFLLSFRALAYETLQKEAALRNIDVLRDLDKGKPFSDQCDIQRHINMSAEGTKRGLADLNRWKREYDLAFLNSEFDKYQFYCAAFARALPVVACGAFYPEFDFRGQPLQRIGRSRAAFEHITFNLTAINGCGVAALVD